MGMPTWVDAWGSGGMGSSVVDHLREVRALGGGVGLWDMQLPAAGWTKPATWEAVQSLRRPTSWLARHWPSFGGSRSTSSEATTVSEHSASIARFRSAPAPTR
jgi:hypothetical protein